MAKNAVGGGPTGGRGGARDVAEVGYQLLGQVCCVLGFTVPVIRCALTFMLLRWYSMWGGGKYL